MKKYLYLIFILGCNDSTNPITKEPSNEWDLEGWNLIWNDEFNYQGSP